MPFRPKLEPGDIVHLSVVTNNHEKFWCSMEGAWDSFADELYASSLLYDVRLHCFVMLPERVDLILSVPKIGIGQVTSSLYGLVTRSINAKSARINHVFGGNHHQSKIGSLESFEIVRKFVFRLPIRLGLSERAETYRFSSLNRQRGFDRLPFPMTEPGNFLDDPGFLNWVNQPFLFSETLIERGLRRKVFRLPRDPKTCRRIRIQDSLLRPPPP